MSERVGLRERNKRQRHSHIEAVAFDLFKRNGFENTTIEQISEVACIAPRTFFSYFATKDDLVLSDYSQRLDQILEVFEHQPNNQSAWIALRDSFATVAADYELEASNIKQRFMIMASSPSVLARNLQLQAIWEQKLTDHLITRLHCNIDDPLPRLFAASALAVMRASLQHWLMTPQTIALPTLVFQGFDQLASGLLASKQLVRSNTPN